MEMFNPPHPGEILLELYMEPEGLTVQEVADLLDVDRKTISRIINKHSRISVEMAMRLAKTFNTSERLWLGLQQSYDIWLAGRDRRVNLSAVKPYKHQELHHGK